MRFIQTAHCKDVLKLRAESCNVSVMVLEPSQTRDDAQSSAGATAVPKSLHWISVIMWAVWDSETNVTAWAERRNNLLSAPVVLSAAVLTSWILNWMTLQNHGGWGASQHDHPGRLRVRGIKRLCIGTQMASVSISISGVGRRTGSVCT